MLVADNPPGGCLDSIGWLENLKRGAVGLIIHPFLPFYHETKFNYGCLFSDRSDCCIREEVVSSMPKIKLDPSQISIFRSHLNSLYDSINSIEIKRLAQQATHHMPRDIPNSKISRLYRSLSDYEPTRIFLISQLAICTVLLSFYLATDIKVIIGRVRNLRRNNDI